MKQSKDIFADPKDLSPVVQVQILLSKHSVCCTAKRVDDVIRKVLAEKCTWLEEAEQR